MLSRSKLGDYSVCVFIFPIFEIILLFQSFSNTYYVSVLPVCVCVSVCILLFKVQIVDSVIYLLRTRTYNCLLMQLAGIFASLSTRGNIYLYTYIYVYYISLYVCNILNIIHEYNNISALYQKSLCLCFIIALNTIYLLFLFLYICI